MKHLPPFLALACLLSLSGCITQQQVQQKIENDQLKLAKDVGRYAEATGTSTNEVLLLKYCHFASTSIRRKLYGTNGVVLAAPTQLYLVNKKVPKNGELKWVAHKYSEMQSVARKKWQIQIESGDDIILIEVAKNSGSFFEGCILDEPGSKTLFDLIASMGVRARETKRMYNLAEESARWSPP